MLSMEIRKELEERLEARITDVLPYTAENSDGEPEQFYAVKFTEPRWSYWLDVDEFGATLGGDACKYDITVF